MKGEKLATFKGKCIGNYSRGESAYWLKKMKVDLLVDICFGSY